MTTSRFEQEKSDQTKNPEHENTATPKPDLMDLNFDRLYFLPPDSGESFDQARTLAEAVMGIGPGSSAYTNPEVLDRRIRLVLFFSGIKIDPSPQEVAPDITLTMGDLTTIDCSSTTTENLIQDSNQHTKEPKKETPDYSSTQSDTPLHESQ